MFFLYTGNVTNAGNNQLILSNTVASGTNRSILDLSELSDADLAGYRLRCAVWITFVLATGFVVAAKLSFGHEGLGLEIFVFCGLLTLLLLICLCIILCGRNPENNSRQENRIQENQITSLTNASLSTTENLRPIPLIRQHPPPPYHIAILIPPPDSSDEAAPPSYDKVFQ
ncbi:PREDICTED: uncharacterized protein LOC106786383 isoform X1 [Polistes canadensis]|uniref:uncharacterized protein LOC106786383 isoform X1 n=1 Tax=Polistes canadensis TaxID=91411 RepID=UPI000718CC10|nr:PREDICTED: uncharacterized protein LOC106786383 isoform X1 [Polistes canadensis]